MSSEISKVGVYDARLVQKHPQFGVYKGGNSVSTTRFTATSATSSQLQFNIQAPSPNVILDRMVEVNYNMFLQFQVYSPVVAINSVVALVGANLGSDWAPCAWPLQSASVASVQATINDSNFTLNSAELLPQVLRLVDSSKALKSRTAPTALDRYLDNSNGVGTISNPTSSYSNTVEAYVPNGAFLGTVITNPAGNALINCVTYADATANGYLIQGPVGANAVYLALNNGVPTIFTGGAQFAAGLVTLYCSIRATEPLALSPFNYYEPKEMSSVGLYGLQTINVLFNLQTPYNAIQSSQSAGVVVPAGGGTGAYGPANTSAVVRNVNFNLNATNGPFNINDCQLSTTFITPPLTLFLPPRNYVDFIQVSRYTTTLSSSPSGRLGSKSSNTFTLPQVPDFMMIYARPATYQTLNQGRWTCSINSINLQFNNVNGLLNSLNQQDLYNISYRNGIDMDFNAWAGAGRVSGAGVSSTVPLVGSILLLRPSIDFALGSETIAPSSVGQYNVQFNIDLTNNSPNVENLILYMVCFNSGYCVTGPGGQTQQIQGVLTESDVISATTTEDPVTITEVNRIVGSGMFNKMSHAMHKMGHMLKKHHKISGGASSGGASHSDHHRRSSRLF